MLTPENPPRALPHANQCDLTKDLRCAGGSFQSASRSNGTGVLGPNSSHMGVDSILGDASMKVDMTFEFSYLRARFEPSSPGGST